MPGYFAHSFKEDQTKWERLEVHLAEVAELAAEYAEAFGAREWGEVAGWWHDLGKYQALFQRRIKGERVQAPHAGVGAALAFQELQGLGAPLAFAIAGHHAGLSNYESREHGPTPLKELNAINQQALQEVLVAASPTTLKVTRPTFPAHLSRATAEDSTRGLAFFTRMLFSALVDADRIATERFHDRSHGTQLRQQRLHYDSLKQLLERLDGHIDRLNEHATVAGRSAVNKLRQKVLQACRQAATKPTGLFSLTVPTGGGKTLSAMSFALRHAMRHNLRRVIVVIPFTSIIEQNARCYREAFGQSGQPDQRNVLEHHSGFDEFKASETNSEAEICRRFAAENWDAPIVVTTTVQFFESLFSNHPSQCRKLHRIAQSVVILDEVQTLPPQFLSPITAALRELTTDYGCSIVLSTATPPALTKRSDFSQGLENVVPIIADSPALFREPAAQRVTTQWRIAQPVSYQELAEELMEHREVLAIVHRRQDARLLAEMLPSKGRFHLSALMCPAHRTQVIAAVRKRLKEGGTCRLVSTQLIEAGVDVDFPAVYRALAGLDSLAQSAGRCDREGRLSEAAGRPAGKFVVFRAETPPPVGTLRKALETTERLFELATTLPELAGGLDPFNPQHGEIYFKEFYDVQGGLDQKNIQRDLAKMEFATVAHNFRLIDDGGASIAIAWEEGANRIDAIRREPSRDNFRALQPYTVQVNRPFFNHLLTIGAIELLGDSWGLPTSLFGDRYDSKQFGLSMEVNDVIDPGLLQV